METWQFLNYAFMKKRSNFSLFDSNMERVLEVTSPRALAVLYQSSREVSVFTVEKILNDQG